MTAPELAAMIDHTILKPDTGAAAVLRLCAEARAHGFASVCVNGTHTARVASALTGSGVKTCVVVGFPLGAGSAAAKAFETRDAVANGADEIDMVLNVGALKDGRSDDVRADIRAVVEAAQGRAVKVILETCLLNRDEKIAACRLSREAGAAFVKTSTGFAGGGATAEDVRLMRATVGPDLGVKASGGIRTLADAHALIAAGANRIGASASVAIMAEAAAERG